MFLILKNSHISIATIEKHLSILTAFVLYHNKEICLSGFGFTTGQVIIAKFHHRKIWIAWLMSKVSVLISKLHLKKCL